MKKYIRHFNQVILLGLIILAAILFLTYKQSSNTKATSAWVFRTQEVRFKIEQVFISLVDNENYTYNFIITGRREFIEPRQKSRENIYNQIDTLRRLTIYNTAQQSQIDSLLFYTSEKLQFSDTVINVRKEKGLQPAMQLVSSAEWKVYMDHVRNIIEQMQIEESFLLLQRKKASEMAGDQFKRIVFTISILLIVFITIFLIRNWLQDNKQKKIKAKLSESEKDFQLLVSSVKEYAIFLLDKEGCVVSWNSGAKHIKGYTAAEIIGKPINVFYTSKDIQNGEPQKNLQMARLYGHYETEGLRVRKNGSFFYANIVFTALTDDKGRFNGFSKVTKDISETKRVKDELNDNNKKLILSQKLIQESEQRFRNIIEQTINPILILKGEDLKLEMANEPLYKLLNIGKECIGKPVIEILPEMRDQPFQKLLVDVVKNGSTHYGNEQPVSLIRENRERETVYFNFVYLPYRENDNRISGVIVQATDVSAQVAARIKLETIEMNLLIANKELSFHNDEKEKRAVELLIANNQLITSETELNKLNIELEQRVKERTEDIATNEKRFRAVVENNHDIINLFDESLRIIYRSPSASRILGWSNDELSNFDIFTNMHPDDRERTEEVIRETITSPGNPINALFRWLHKCGNYLLLEGTITNLLKDDNVKAFVFNFRDVTERMEVNEKLLASEARYRRLFESAKDGILILNSDTGIIEDVNPYLITMLGYSHAEFLHKELWEIGLFKDIVENKSAFEKLKKDGYSRYDNLPLQTKTHKAFYVEFVSNVYDVDGKQVVQCNIRDITERKKAEQIIIKLNTELEERVLRRTEQLKKTNEELEAFSYSVSHDLRAPLRAIIGFSAILEEDYSSKLDTEARRLTTVIRNNTLKMSNLIDGLISFSRMSRHNLKKTIVNSNEIIQHIIDELEIKNEFGAINWVIHSLSTLKGDFDTIRQVWVNLISNAIKYSRHSTIPRIEIKSYFQNDQVVFLIKDNGAGFNQKYSDKLFKVFQRLHNNEEFEGTGIGLALVEKIVTKHGGKVWAEGIEGKGASFYFSLPVD